MAQEKDIVLIYFEDKPLVFARIEQILTDIKPDWYHVKLLLLQIPLQSVTWILRNAYINGDEFTMDGKRLRLELIESPDDTDEFEDTGEKEETQNHKQPEKGKVISFQSLRKK